MEQSIVLGTSKELGQMIKNKKEEIEKFKRDLKAPQSKPTYNLKIEEVIYEALCKKIEQTLIGFGYNDENEVKFNVDEQDIIINEGLRKNNGKGFRAFFYTAFSVALMDFLLTNQCPYSRVLILDSPLTTLKEEDMKVGQVKEGDLIADSLQTSFYINLAERNSDTQVIVIDNKVIPEEIKPKCNHIEFTKDIHQGRYGFF